MVAVAHSHPIELRGANWGAATPGLRVVERTDSGFIPALLDDLTTPAGRDRVTAAGPRTLGTDGVVRLFQPVHRTFNVALVEAVCAEFDLPGLQPRLDPRRIESAGLVVRRVAEDPQPDEGRFEAWSAAGPALLGWRNLRTPDEENADPDPARRRVLRAGDPTLDERLAERMNLSDLLTETTTPLFVAPPAVCAAAGRTLLYGVIPVTSPDFSEAAPDDGFDPDFLRDHLVPPLRAGGGPIVFPSPGTELRPTAATNPSDANAGAIPRYLALLRQLHLEFGAFGDTAEGRALLAALDGVGLTMADGSTRPAGGELARAARSLVEGRAGEGAVAPREWPTLGAAAADAIAAAALAALRARLADVRPREGRFDPPRRRPTASPPASNGARAVRRAHLTRLPGPPRYVARAFVRVRRPDGCPPLLVWSDHGEPFTIAPWYETNPASTVPPPRVALPNLLRPDSLRPDTEALKRLKPSVTFEVPEGLFNLLQNGKPEDLRDGKGPPSGPRTGLDWICGFSIPIITLCAFIVLNIFLQLFNLIFQWLLFIKICIPVPRRGP